MPDLWSSRDFAGLALLSEVLNFDFGGRDLDAPFTDAELASIGGLQAIRDRVVKLSGKRNPSARDFVQYSDRGTIRELPLFVRTARDVAEKCRNGSSAAHASLNDT